MAFSLAWSTSVTKSFDCFCETRTDSTSSAARLMMAPAARAALMATLSMGWSVDDMDCGPGQHLRGARLGGKSKREPPVDAGGDNKGYFTPVAMKTRFILIQTSHAGNVGGAARAMKVMGFDELVLVAPRWDNVLRREETIQRASGALDVLNQARIVDTLEEALDGLTHLCATAMTPRDFGPPTSTPRPHFEALLTNSPGPKGWAFCLARSALACATKTFTAAMWL